MVFSSLLFIFGFLPVFLTAYYLTPRKYRNYAALLGSYFFYGWGAPRFLFVLVGACAVDYLLAKGICRFSAKRKYFLAASLIGNAGLLIYFKYANFFVGEFNNLFGMFGFEGAHWTNIALPIGISFFTFQKISYVVDVYRERVPPAKNIWDYLLYIALFSQLIAGPIVRYHDIAEQLKQRTYSAKFFFDGIFRFCVGLGKKVLIANALGEVADKIFALPISDLPLSYAWVGVIAYAFQIYFDFSGYSDMAIGLGRMMGFDFLENFNRPYISQNFTEFWRRWHISLSNWMKEYVYIPLGGKHRSLYRILINIMIVFLFSGLWHGAGWTFVVWGAYHGFFICLDKLGGRDISQKLPKAFNIAFTFVLLLFSWVFFRSAEISSAFLYIWRMVDLSQIGNITPVLLWIEIISRRARAVLIVAALISFLPAFFWLGSATGRLKSRLPVFLSDGARFAAAVVLFFLAAITLANGSFNPFIYFRF